MTSSESVSPRGTASSGKFVSREKSGGGGVWPNARGKARRIRPARKIALGNRLENGIITVL